jgi:hypothetical protein
MGRKVASVTSTEKERKTKRNEKKCIDQHVGLATWG